MTKNVVIFCLFSIAVFGQGKNDYFPLEVGKEWSYIFNNSLVAKGTVEKYKIIQYDKKEKAWEIEKTVTNDDGDSVVTIGYIKKTNNKIVKITKPQLNNFIKTRTEEVLVVLNKEPGFCWTFEIFMADTLKNICSIKKIIPKMEIMLFGTFQTLTDIIVVEETVLRKGTLIGQSLLYYAPNLGLIKVDRIKPNGGLLEYKRMIKFN